MSRKRGAEKQPKMRKNLTRVFGMDGKSTRYPSDWSKKAHNAAWHIVMYAWSEEEACLLDLYKGERNGRRERKNSSSLNSGGSHVILCVHSTFNYKTPRICNIFVVDKLRANAHIYPRHFSLKYTRNQQMYLGSVRTPNITASRK